MPRSVSTAKPEAPSFPLSYCVTWRMQARVFPGRLWRLDSLGVIHTLYDARLGPSPGAKSSQPDSSRALQTGSLLQEPRVCGFLCNESVGYTATAVLQEGRL